MQNTKEITTESRLFEVIMLATKKDSHIQILKTNEFDRVGTLRYYKEFISESETAKPQHLYLLADGYPIKPGDYYYSMMGNYKYGVSKCTVEDEQCNEGKTPKVVATTDATIKEHVLVGVRYYRLKRGSLHLDSTAFRRTF